MSLRGHIADATIASYGSKATYAGAGTAAVSGWFSLNAAATVIGIFVAIAGLAVNFYFSHKRAEREREIHALDKLIRERDLAKSMPSWEQRPTHLIPDDGN